LYLSFFFPPSRASGVYRGRATANHLVAKGWDVTVFAAPLRFLYEAIGSVDEELASTVDGRIRVVRPGFSQFPWQHDLRRFGRFRATMPVLARRLHMWGQAHVFPEPYGSWGLSAVARAVRMHARRRFDVVVATGNPFASFAAAWLFHKLTGVPYVVDYRDSWTLNLFTDGPAFPDDHPAWRWERRVLSQAAGVVFVNEALRGWHAARYPRVADKMMVVPNGWDADLMRPPAGPAAHPGGPLRFGYLGTLTRAQPVEELAAAFRLARRHPDLADAQLDIHGHLGFFRNSPAELMTRLGLPGDDPAGGDEGIVYRGPVSKTEVGAVYGDSDVLVFLAGGGRYVTSGKIFEYMAAGRPIVSVHTPDIAATEVLAGYPLWFTAHSLDPDEIAQTMIAAGKAARDLTPDQHAAAVDYAGTYARVNLIAPLESRLYSVIKRPTSIVRSHSAPPDPPALPTDRALAHANAYPAAPGEVRPPRHVVVLSSYRSVPARTARFVRSLLELGVRVDLFVLTESSWDGYPIGPGLRLHVPKKAESAHPLLRAERFVVYRLPGGMLARAARLAGHGRLAPAVTRPVSVLQRGHRRTANAAHRRLFMQAYRLIRSVMLARLFGPMVRELDLGAVDRIVAADLDCVTFGRRLAQACPWAVATTALDLGTSRGA
jgi:glycosyltransferase involved in cell wall biosynthesis